MSAIVGPIPPYSNVPINADYYSPSRFVIFDITLGQTTLVTTTVDHNYVIGQEVRLIIPPTFGCRQLNEQTGVVLSIPDDDEVVLNIYSAGGDPYVSSSATTKAQILAIGDVNSGLFSTTGRVQTSTTIPGTFINVSP